MKYFTIDQISDCLNKYKKIQIVPAECDEIMLYPSTKGLIAALLSVTDEQNTNSYQLKNQYEEEINKLTSKINDLNTNLLNKTLYLKSIIEVASTTPPQVKEHTCTDYKKNCQNEKEKTENEIKSIQQDIDENKKLKEKTENDLKTQSLIIEQYQKQAPVREMLKVRSEINNKKIEDRISNENEIIYEVEESTETLGLSEEYFEEFLAYG